MRVEDTQLRLALLQAFRRSPDHTVLVPELVARAMCELLRRWEVAGAIIKVSEQWHWLRADRLECDLSKAKKGVSDV